MKDRNVLKKPKKKKPLFDATPQKNAFLPMLLATVCMGITLLAVTEVALDVVVRQADPARPGGLYYKFRSLS